MAEQTIIQSPVDDNNYRYLVLENGLKVVLISDPDADKSAASLDVNAGNGADPDEWGGLAHFLEHMLFLGTKKYPNAGEYQSFIKANGGSNNAYTSFDHTNYFFSISPAFFEQALDRFSRFFIDPTFDELYVDRERSVVHSEYQARKKDEGRRLWDAQKQWLNPNHPASRFSIGSMDTLRDRKSSMARDQLIEFYKQYYSASIMTLSIFSNHSLDELEKWVVEKFSQIPNNGIAPLQFSQPYINLDLVPARLNTIPEKELHSVSFVFPVPSTHGEYRSKPFNYIANLLGHEGVGSLDFVLKQKGWAETLSVGLGYMDKVHSTFTVRVGLTEDGVSYIDEIGYLLFKKIAMIRNNGIDQWRFEEQKQLGNIAFRFAQGRDVGRMVQSISSRMHLYAPEDILSGPYIMESYSADRIRQLLDYLTPTNVNIQVTSPTLETDKRSEYYDVSYSLEPVAPETIELWQSVDLSDSSDLMHLPEPNPFIPKRLDLLSDKGHVGKPEKVDLDSELQLWFLQDTEFATPRANFYFNFMLPEINSSVRSLILAELYVRMINNQLNDIVYPAYLADINYSLYRHGRGISVRISGYEDQQSRLFALLVDAMKAPEYDAEKFDIIKQGLIRELSNVDKDSPSNQSVHEVYRLILMPYWNERERLTALEDMTVRDLEEFVPVLFSRARAVALSHGDVSLEKSVQRAKLLATVLDKAEFVDQVNKPTARILSQENIYLRSLSIDHTDSALAIYIQGRDDSLRERARLALLNNLMESPFYNQLRTINRVGYLVHAGTVDINRRLGLLFSVQSPTHSPKEIYELYQIFIMDFKEKLSAMSAEEFLNIKNGLISSVLQRAKNLGERSGRLWYEVDWQKWDFDSREKFAEMILELPLEEMQETFSSLIAGGGARLIVQYSGIGREGEVDIENAIITGDSAVFKSLDRVD